MKMKMKIEKKTVEQIEVEITLPYYAKYEGVGYYYLIYGEGVKDCLRVCNIKDCYEIDQYYTEFALREKSIVQIAPNEFHKVYDEVTNELLILLNKPFKLDAQKLANEVIETIKTIGE